jgi:hypothetical protein
LGSPLWYLRDWLDPCFSKYNFLGSTTEGCYHGVPRGTQDIDRARVITEFPNMYVVVNLVLVVVYGFLDNKRTVSTADTHFCSAFRICDINIVYI